MELKGISRESDDSFDVIFLPIRCVRPKDHDIPSLRVSDEILIEQACVREFVHDDEFLVMVALVHGASADLERGGDVSTDDHDDDEDDSKVDDEFDELLEYGFPSFLMLRNLRYRHFSAISSRVMDHWLRIRGEVMSRLEIGIRHFGII